jgi:acetoacetyl-CoA synthetase
MRRFIAANRAQLRGDDYAALWDWSVEAPAEFWAAVWDFCGIRARRRYDTVLRDAAQMPGAKWFEGAQLNFAENLLEHDASGAALVFGNERGERMELSWD